MNKKTSLANVSYHKSINNNSIQIPSTISIDFAFIIHENKNNIT